MLGDLGAFPSETGSCRRSCWRWSNARKRKVPPAYSVLRNLQKIQLARESRAPERQISRAEGPRQQLHPQGRSVPEESSAATPCQVPAPQTPIVWRLIPSPRAQDVAFLSYSLGPAGLRRGPSSSWGSLGGGLRNGAKPGSQQGQEDGTAATVPCPRHHLPAAPWGPTMRSGCSAVPQDVSPRPHLTSRGGRARCSPPGM